MPAAKLPTAMIEVFKTNVTHAPIADELIALIHENFKGYRANFDLDDCDRILRVENPVGMVNAVAIISLLKTKGYAAEILADDLESVSDPFYRTKRFFWSFLPN